MTTSGEAVTHNGRRALRPSAKVLPEHARGHNRALVLQLLHDSGRQSRADLARSTGLTRVTISDLVAELMAEGLVVELGYREGSARGKPAILLDIDRRAFQIVGIDLSGYSAFRGALLDLGGQLLQRSDIPLAGSEGEDAFVRVITIVETLLAQATAPVLGIGVGSPGIVDDAGVVLSAPNLGWTQLQLRRRLAERFALPVVVLNDANTAVLAEHSFGEARGDMMLVRVGLGVGAGLVLGGVQLFGSSGAAGEIGHVVVGTDGGDACSCGKRGCLETWLAVPKLEARMRAAETASAKEAVLREAGKRLGIALAPIVGALDLAEIVLSGPEKYLAGTLAAAALETLRARTMAEFHGGLVLRMTTLADDIVLRGAAVAVLSKQLGFS